MCTVNFDTKVKGCFCHNFRVFSYILLVAFWVNWYSTVWYLQKHKYLPSWKCRCNCDCINAKICPNIWSQGHSICKSSKNCKRSPSCLSSIHLIFQINLFVIERLSSMRGVFFQKKVPFFWELLKWNYPLPVHFSREFSRFFFSLSLLVLDPELVTQMNILNKLLRSTN